MYNTNYKIMLVRAQKQTNKKLQLQKFLQENKWAVHFDVIGVTNL